MIKFFKRKKWLKISIIVLILIFSSLVGLFVFIFRPYSVGSPPQIPLGWGAKKAVAFKGTPATAKQISVTVAPRHPYLADTNSNNMHVDYFASDTHKFGGPIGVGPVVKSYAHGRIGGECACVTFDSRGNIVAVCATLKKFSLLLISPDDLMPLARMDLPPRASNKSLNLRKIMSDTSGGAYFFLDNQDRAVLIDAHQKLKVIGQRWNNERPRFEVEEEYDLLPIIKENSVPKDVATSVLPDWQGRYWFVTRFGLIGVVNPKTKEVCVIRLHKEEIQNSFAIDQNGTYIVSDYALYGLRTKDDSDQPFIVWREEYERASRKKLGSITLGSGTTPTLLGEKYIAIADNAEPRINVLVYRREMHITGSRLICKIPVFKKGESATENTFIGVGKSIIVENNYGYDLFIKMMFGRTGAGGIARIDFSDDGNYEVKWINPIISQTTVPKLSLETGLVYVYAKDPSIGKWIDAYYLAGLDFETGKTVFQILTGTGVSFDNNWAPITIGPDRSAYIGVLRGLVKVSDRGGVE